MVQHAQADHQQQQQQEEDAASEEKSLLLLPNDVWEHIMTTTDPKDICRMGCSSQTLSRLANRKRRGVLLARHWGRLQLHVVRQSMQARGDFVSKLCSRQGLDSREASQAHILDTLQRSPDPVPDLAAAVQQGLALVTSQTSLCAPLAAPIKSDLVRCANFVCLLAWRQHMRKKRLQAAGEQVGPAAAAGVGGGNNAGEVAAVQGAAAGVAAANVQNAPAVLQEQPQAQQQPHPQQQQQPEVADAQPQPVLQAAAVQTELGPSLLELQELLSGFSALMAAPGNPSLRLLRPSLNLLHHLLMRQLQAWNLPQPQAHAQLQAAQQGGAVEGDQQGLAMGVPGDGAQGEEGAAVAAAVIDGIIGGIVDAEDAAPGAV